MKQSVKWLAAIAITGILTGCSSRTVPVEQVRNTVSAGHNEAQVRTAILKAGLKRKWIMSDVSPGVIKGRLQNRDHSAEIRVLYSATSYSINYDSSINLMASGGEIHRNYNRWVRNLDQDIQLNLSAGAGL